MMTNIESALNGLTSLLSEELKALPEAGTITAKRHGIDHAAAKLIEARRTLEVAIASVKADVLEDWNETEAQGVLSVLTQMGRLISPWCLR